LDYNKISITAKRWIFNKKEEVFGVRSIKGYVCIAIDLFASRPREVPFGKNIGKDDRAYQAFQMNNLTPFKSISEAQIARGELEERNDIGMVSIAWIEMKLAETLEEIYLLEGRKNLVVVRSCADEPNKFELVGYDVRDENPRYPLLGADLTDNGFVPFSSFDTAEYIASEENRQSGSPTSIANFTLERKE
jgi:hypothetical protein